MKFKTVRYSLKSSSCVDTFEVKDLSALEIADILRNPNLIKLTATKMPLKQALLAGRERMN